MLIVIAADASKSGGIGHVARSLAIAEFARDKGHDLVWLVSPGGRRWVEYLAAAGSAPFIIQEIKSWTFGEVLEVAGSYIPDFLLLDSYLLTSVEVGIPRLPFLIAAIADEATPYQSANLCIVPDPVSVVQESTFKQATVHQGAEFVLIRRAVRDLKLTLAKTPSLSTRNRYERVAVLLGGTDAGGLREKIVRFIQGMGIEVATTQGEPSALSDQQAQGVGQGIRQLLWAVQADFVVSAAGVSSWELLYLNIPFGVIQVSDNQRSNYAFLTQNRLAMGFGSAEDLRGLAKLPSALGSIHQLVERRNATSLCPDGLGGLRALNLLEEFFKRIRLENSLGYND